MGFPNGETSPLSSAAAQQEGADALAGEHWKNREQRSSAVLNRKDKRDGRIYCSRRGGTDRWRRVEEVSQKQNGWGSDKAKIELKLSHAIRQTPSEACLPQFITLQLTMSKIHVHRGKTINLIIIRIIITLLEK